MKKAILISFLSLFFSCQNKTVNIRYYPSEDYLLSKTDILKIDLDTDNLNFEEITQKVSKNQYFGGYTLIEIEGNEVVKRIIPIHDDVGLYKIKNKLRIKSDSILIDDGHPISDLKRILKRHYTNNGKNYKYSDSPQKSVVEINLDSNKTAKDLKQLLTNLTDTFDEINNEVSDTLQLVIFFNYFNEVPSTTPPISNEK